MTATKTPKTKPTSKSTADAPPIVQGVPVTKPTTNPETTMKNATPATPATPVKATTSADGPATSHDSDRARMRLADLCQSIQEVQAEIGGILRQAVPHARRVGGLLAEAKTTHATLDGDQSFAEWVQAKLQMTIQTANRYIRISENWDRMVAEYDPTSIDDAATWISEHPAPNAKKPPGGANNHNGPRMRNLELPKKFLTASRLHRAGKSAEDFKTVVNEALLAAGVSYQFV